MKATPEARVPLADPADALQRIEAVLRLTRSVVWEVDRDGVFTYVSPSFEDLLGYSPEDLVGRRTIHDFYAPDLPSALRREVAEDWIGAGEEFTNVELPLVAKSGAAVWVSSSGMPIRDAAGEITGFRGVDADITSRKVQEERLRRSNERMQLAARAGGIGFWELDCVNGREDWDAGMLRIYGLRGEDFPGTTAAWLELVHAEDRHALAAAYEEAQRQGDEARQEFRIVRPDGEVRHIASMWTVTRDQTGRAVRMAGINQDMTERNRSISLLAQSEEKFRLMIEKAPVAISYTDRATGLVHFNAAYEALFGYARDKKWTREELAGRLAASIAGGSDLARWDEMKRKTRERGESLRVEVPLATDDGSLRDVEMTSIPLPGVDFNVILDLTERKRVLRDLQESGQRLRAVIDNTPVPIGYTAPGDQAINTNKAFTEAYGWTEEDLPTVEVWFEKAYPDPDYRQQVLTWWNKAVDKAVQSDGRISPRQYRVTAKDGKVHEVEISAVVLEGEIFGSFLDLTERNRVEHLLRESEAQLLGLVENAPLGIVRLDLLTGALRPNKAITELLGYTAEDIPTMGEWMCRAYPDEDYRAQVSAEWAKALPRALARGGRLDASEVTVVDLWGHEHEMQFSGVVLGAEVFGLWVDLTERNRAERQLREQRKQLAHVGRVSVLGQLAASLAHELDQPLGAILNNAETARLLLETKKPDPAELRTILGDIIDDDRRAGAVLDRIRAMVRRQSFTPVQVDVRKLCREVVGLVRPALRRNKVKLEMSCEPGLAAVEGDRVLLQQALLNLLLNSVDAIGARKGGRIELRAEEAGKGEIEIAVGDNGGGVPVSEQASLLEPFHTTKEGGLGMGLPIVHSIIEQHGGRLRLDNQPGRGLAVYLRLRRWGRTESS
jgi:PAS domain S-box-containing protein